MGPAIDVQAKPWEKHPVSQLHGPRAQKWAGTANTEEEWIPEAREADGH